MAKDGRIILKRTNAALFYKAPNTWVESMGDAFDFGELLKAHAFCKEKKLTGVAVIMDFNDPYYNVLLNMY